jgi:Right handed beta helix region
MRRFLPVAATLFTFAALVVPGSSAAPAVPGCGDVLTGDAVLTVDLVCSGNALIVPGFADVTLDLNGHSIVGVGVGTGITILPSLNEDPSRSTPGSVTVENGSVHGFQVGVGVNGFFQSGIAALGLRELLIRDNGIGISGFTPGVVMTTTVSDSIIANNDSDGVQVAHIRPFRMIHDQVRDNGGSGIAALDQDGLSLLQNSRITRNGGSGASLHDTVAVVTGNTFRRNAGTGLSISESVCAASSQYVVADNTATQNAHGGMSMAFPVCNPTPPPPPGSRNTAQHNLDFQCILIVCASNRGQAK